MADQGGGRYGLLDLPEPVVSADADFNRGVSRAEFQARRQPSASSRSTSTTRGASHLPVLETLQPRPRRTAAPKPERPREDPDDERACRTRHGPGL